MSISKKSATLIFAIITLVAPGVFWINSRMQGRTVSYACEAQFAAIPADDSALRMWITSQPGVSKTSVRRSNGGIEVSFVIRGNDPTPDLEKRFKHFGYLDSQHFHVTAWKMNRSGNLMHSF